MPKLSVVVPVYNVEKYLDECLRSIEAQTLADIEILCVDNNSTDDSRAILEEHAARDSRIVVLEEPQQGLPSARNKGLDVACGEYVAFVDSDDTIAPQFYEHAVEALDRDGSDVVAFRFQGVYPDGHKTLSSELEPRCVSSAELGAKLFGCTNPAVWNKVYRASCLRARGLRYCPQLTAIEDIPFTYGALAIADKISFVNEVAYFYKRDLPSSITMNRKASNNCALLFEAFDQLNAFVQKNQLPDYVNDAVAMRYLTEFHYAITISSSVEEAADAWHLFEQKWKPVLLDCRERLELDERLVRFYVESESLEEALLKLYLEARENIASKNETVKARNESIAELKRQKASSEARLNETIAKKQSRIEKLLAKLEKSRAATAKYKDATARYKSSSARYKAMAIQRREENEALRNSWSYKLGHALLKPFSLLKKLLKRG